MGYQREPPCLSVVRDALHETNLQGSVLPRWCLSSVSARMILMFPFDRLVVSQKILNGLQRRSVIIDWHCHHNDVYDTRQQKSPFFFICAVPEVTFLCSASEFSHFYTPAIKQSTSRLVTLCSFLSSSSLTPAISCWFTEAMFGIWTQCW